MIEVRKHYPAGAMPMCEAEYEEAARNVARINSIDDLYEIDFIKDFEKSDGFMGFHFDEPIYMIPLTGERYITLSGKFDYYGKENWVLAHIYFPEEDEESVIAAIKEV